MKDKKPSTAFTLLKINRRLISLCRSGCAKATAVARLVTLVPLLLSLLLGLAGCSESQQGTDAAPQLSEEEAMLEEGRRKARICTGCHGPNGISRIPQNPSLAGLPEEYTKQQLQAFRSGERENATMSSIAMNLSDKDIEALSRYFASLPGPAGG